MRLRRRVIPLPGREHRVRGGPLSHFDGNKLFATTDLASFVVTVIDDAGERTHNSCMKPKEIQHAILLG